MLNRRIGPKMQQAVSFVRQNPGCAKLPVAAVVGPRGSINYGYQIVDRAIRAGLIHAEKRPGNKYALFVR